MSSAKKLILLDFDHTIFDTTQFIASWQERFEEHGISKEDFQKHRQELKNCCQAINIDLFANKIDPSRAQELHTVVELAIAETASNFIFPDVHDFLERHHPEFDIMILTHGDTELQTLKIANAGLPEYIKPIISLNSKSESGSDIIAQYSGEGDEIHFFDDKAANIDDVKQVHPQVRTYFMKRPNDNPYGAINSVCECADEVVQDLSISLLSQ